MTQDVNAAYMSSPQAAKILKITYVGVAQLARQGKIPAVKIANRWLIPKAFVEEFAKTYEGKRGRPRKKGPRAECSERLAAIQPDQLGLADTSAIPEVRDSRHEADEALAVNAQVDHLEEMPASITQPGELAPTDTSAVSEAKDSRCEIDAALPMNVQVDRLEEVPADTSVVSEARDSKPEADAALAMNAQADHLEDIPTAISQPEELASRDTSPVSEAGDSKREGDETCEKPPVHPVGPGSVFPLHGDLKGAAEIRGRSSSGGEGRRFCVYEQDGILNQQLQFQCKSDVLLRPRKVGAPANKFGN